MKTTLFVTNSTINFNTWLNSNERNLACWFPEDSRHPIETIRYFELLINDYAKKENNLVVVTHSEAIINWIGEKIGKKEFNNEDFEIVIIDDDGSRHIFCYDKDGYIEKWRYGFFRYKS